MKILTQTDERCDKCEGRGWYWSGGEMNREHSKTCSECLGFGGKLRWVELGTCINQLSKDNRISEINV